MSSRIRLTLNRISELQNPESGKAFLWDTDSPTLAVVATPKKKNYIFQTRLDRKTIRMTIGDIKTFSLDDARSEANRLKSLVNQGIDPREEKRRLAMEAEAARQDRKLEKKREKLSDTKLSVLWDEYIKDRESEWGERHYLDHVRLSQPGGDTVKRGKGKKKPGPLALLMSKKISDLSTEVLLNWLKGEAKKRPGQARLAFGLFKTFLIWCEEHQEYRLFLSSSILTKKVLEQRPKKKAKIDSLQKEQLPAWFKAVREIHNPVIAAYLQILLLTGARRNELAKLKWDDIDFRWNKLTIKDKVEGTRTIPLTPYVKHLIKWLPRRNAWVFSSPSSKTGNITEPRIAHNKAIKEASIDDLTIHGLRRSFSTLSEWCEVPTGVVAQIMGHKPSATAERHYKIRPIDLLRKWHTKIEAWILSEAGIQYDFKNKSEELKLVENAEKQGSAQ